MLFLISLIIILFIFHKVSQVSKKVAHNVLNGDIPSETKRYFIKATFDQESFDKLDKHLISKGKKPLNFNIETMLPEDHKWVENNLPRILSE